MTEFIDRYRRSRRVDRDRVYITGVSMGAYAVWQLCISHPDWFAAAVPVCGSGMYWDAARLKKLPVWAFHGGLDNVVYPEESQKMVSAINRNSGCAKLTVFPQDGHNAWDSAFSSDEMWKWLFEQKRMI
ncbi:MAG: prolyl oligopeptidase family serine peptidase [Oscillospiraceae bacterium]|nr:prolyl oligopeptidase family serine peptidase [Oscillospiraceae bacterium]